VTPILPYPLHTLLSFSHIETSKGDAEKTDCAVATTVKIRTPEGQSQNLVVVGLHVVLASEAVVYEGFWQQRRRVDQVCKEGREIREQGFWSVLPGARSDFCRRHVFNFRESHLFAMTHTLVF
jgi:hypothetical protein